MANVGTTKTSTSKTMSKSTSKKEIQGLILDRNVQINEECCDYKVIDKEKILKVGLIGHIKREISILRRVRHPNIVQLFEVMATKSKIFFIMEYVRGGELFNKVAKGRLKEEVARSSSKFGIYTVVFVGHRLVCKLVTIGLKGPLAIAAEIFELTPSLRVVEVKKKGGDKLEYEEFCNRELKPGLLGLQNHTIDDTSDVVHLPSDTE
ncbi:hypothetical protein Leryth_026268 [Lithospermum erythrorhizon]|nr:hypothetical protein Leryth_026268 [Lithospermum erythrorhizon]